MSLADSESQSPEKHKKGNDLSTSDQGGDIDTFSLATEDSDSVTTHADSGDTDKSLESDVASRSESESHNNIDIEIDEMLNRMPEMVLEALRTNLLLLAVVVGNVLHIGTLLSGSDMVIPWFQAFLRCVNKRFGTGFTSLHSFFHVRSRSSSSYLGLEEVRKVSSMPGGERSTDRCACAMVCATLCVPRCTCAAMCM